MSNNEINGKKTQGISYADERKGKEFEKSICKHGEPYTFKKHANSATNYILNQYKEEESKGREVEVEKVLKVGRTK